MQSFLIALTVAIPAFFGPWIAIRANGRERRKDQQLTWERDDQVAEKAAEAAGLLLAAQQDLIARTDEVARHVAEEATVTSAKLDALDVQGKKIHTLVNQKLTDVTEKALAATAALLAALEESADDQQALGRPPTVAAVERIAQTRRDVASLRGTLADRAGQQAVVDADANDAS